MLWEEAESCESGFGKTKPQASSAPPPTLYLGFLSALSPACPPQRFQRLWEPGQQRVARTPHEPDLLQRQQWPGGRPQEENSRSLCPTPGNLSVVHAGVTEHIQTALAALSVLFMGTDSIVSKG